MTKKIYILFLLVVFRSSICTAANTVTISDANFLSYLTTTYGSPTIVGNQLDTNQAALKTGTLNCRARGIANIFGIQYFKALTVINITRNSISVIPELKGFTNLQTLTCDSNLLTSLPSLNTIPTLTFISCRVNYLTSIPSLTGLSNLTTIICSNNSITQFPSLTGLLNITSIDCAENQLTQLPASISTLINLENLFCGRNNLTALPDLSGLTKLQFLFCSNNSLTSLPISNACIALKYLRISNNKINQLPDLSFLVAPVIVYLDHNDLSFEDLIPVVNNSNYSSYKPAFLLFPQNNFGNYADTLIKKKGTFIFNLGIDAYVSPMNTYNWYKNGNLVFTGNSNSYTKSNALFSDTGNYTVVVKNAHSAFLNDSLISTSKKLKIGQCFFGNPISYTTTNISCNEGFKVSIDPSSIYGGTSPFTYMISNMSTGEMVKSKFPILSGIKEGEYTIQIKDAISCETPPVFCQLVAGSDCDPVFSPNGDGNSDTYYISSAGNARIFNKSGILINELATPAYWNGLDKNGQEVPSGYYVIIVNEKTTMNVSLMR